MNNENVPIIGQSSINPDPEVTPEDIPMRMVEKAFLIYLDENGKWQASSDVMTPTETFRPITAEDVMNGCQRVRENLRDQDTAATVINANIQVARQMQEAQQNQQLLSNLDLRTAR